MGLEKMEQQLGQLKAQRTALVNQLAGIKDPIEQERVEEQILDLYMEIVALEERIMDLDYPDHLIG